MRQAQDWRERWQKLALELETISFFTRQQVCSILDISNSTLKRDTWVCNELLDWDYEPYSRGFTLESLKILWVFRFLVRQLGRKQAIKLLFQTLQEDHERQTSCQ